jgi:hypothetical protein
MLSWGLNWLTAAVVGLGGVLLLAALGVDIAALGIGSALAVAAGIGSAHYRSSASSQQRQRANRQAHRANSPLWQPNENDDVH